MSHRILFVSLASAALAFGGSSERIRINQIGYAANMPKFAISRDTVSTGVLVDSATGATVFTARLGNSIRWTAGGDTTRIFDFTSFTAPGTYYLRIGAEESWPIRISPNPYLDLARGAIKAFWFQRSSYALPEQWAGRWARAAGHPDTAVVVHGSAATAARPAGSRIRSPGGWYDAGDYGKYVVNSGITTWTLLNLHETRSAFFDTLRLGVPPHGGPQSDLVDEILWNLRWMLSMQDPADGGVYHKLTTANFSAFVLPASDRATRYVVQKSTGAALNLAATAAYAARIFKDSTSLPGFADSCRTAALQAWAWARANPDSLYDQTAVSAAYSPAISTGTYADSDLSNEFTWAASELFLTTGLDSFSVAESLWVRAATSWTWPGWGDPGTLGWLSLRGNKGALTGSLSGSGRVLDSMLVASAKTIRNYRVNNGYHYPQGGFWWGGNSAFGNNAILLWKAWEASGDSSYLNASLEVLDYLLGRNPTGYSFVTGFGSRTPMNPHHRPSGGDTVVAPVPGFLVGGPNSSAAKDDKCADYPSKLTGATTVIGPKEYVDEQDCYASNEVAINWNAPLAWIAGSWAARLETPAASVRPGSASLRSSLAARVRGGSVELSLGGRAIAAAELVSADGRILSSVRRPGTSAVLPAPRGLVLARAVAADGSAATVRLLVP